jgi:hypothetical protein
MPSPIGIDTDEDEKELNEDIRTVVERSWQARATRSSTGTVKTVSTCKTKKVKKTTDNLAGTNRYGTQECMAKIRDDLCQGVTQLQEQVKVLANITSASATANAEATLKSRLSDILKAELLCAVCISIRIQIWVCDGCKNIVCAGCLEILQSRPCPYCRMNDPPLRTM